MFYDSSFIFQSHSVSIGRDFGLYFAHQCLSNRRRPYIFIYVVAANVISFENFSMAVTLSVRSSQLLCCKIFVLKYFRRTSTLRKFFQQKFHITKISRFTVVTNHSKSTLSRAHHAMSTTVVRCWTHTSGRRGRRGRRGGGARRRRRRRRSEEEEEKGGRRRR